MFHGSCNINMNNVLIIIIIIKVIDILYVQFGLACPVYIISIIYNNGLLTLITVIKYIIFVRLARKPKSKYFFWCLPTYLDTRIHTYYN